MIGLDTNVLVVGVMQSCYKATKQEILSILDMLLRTPELSIENTETAMQAASAFGVSTADFADCVIEQTAHKAGCRYTARLT